MSDKLEVLNESFTGTLEYIPENLNESYEGKTIDGQEVLVSLKGPLISWNMTDDGRPLVDQANGNMRWYKKKLVMDKIVNSPYLKSMLGRKALLMEGRHPDERMEIDHSFVIGRVREVKVIENSDETGYVEGIVDVLATEKGKDFAVLVKAGYKPGVSIRAAGTTVSSRLGGKEIQYDSYKFYTWDFVWRPGWDIAIVSVLNEGMDNIGDVISTIDETDPQLEKLMESEREKQTLELVVQSLNEEIEETKIVRDSALEEVGILLERLEETTLEIQQLKEAVAKVKGESVQIVNEEVDTVYKDK